MLAEKKKYAAVVTDAGITDKDGVAQPYMKLNVTDEAGGVHAFTYYGSLKSEKSSEFAVKALVAAGFTGDDFAALQTGVLAFNPAAKFTVELENYTNTQGKTNLKIKWVNPASSMTKFAGAVPKQAALFAKVKQELGIKKTVTKTDDWGV